MRPGRASRAGGWVPPFLPISLAASTAPTWAEQGGGVRGRGRGSVCCARGGGGGQAGRQGGLTLCVAAPGSSLCAPRPGSGDSDLLSGQDTEGTGQPRPLSRSPEALDGSPPPSPSLVRRRNRERYGNGGGVRGGERGWDGTGRGRRERGDAESSGCEMLQGIWRGVGDGNGRVGAHQDEKRKW